MKLNGQDSMKYNTSSNRPTWSERLSYGTRKYVPTRPAREFLINSPSSRWNGDYIYMLFPDTGIEFKQVFTHFTGTYPLLASVLRLFSEKFHCDVHRITSNRYFFFYP
jgi:hypothetical protein